MTIIFFLFYCPYSTVDYTLFFFLFKKFFRFKFTIDGKFTNLIVQKVIVFLQCVIKYNIYNMYRIFFKGVMQIEKEK